MNSKKNKRGNLSQIAKQLTESLTDNEVAMLGSALINRAKNRKPKRLWNEAELKLVNAFSEMFDDFETIEKHLPALAKMLNRSDDAVRMKIDEYRYDHLDLPTIYTRPGFHFNPRTGNRRKMIPLFKS